MHLSWSIRSLENSVSNLRLELSGNQTSVEVNRSDVRANKTDGSKSAERKKAFMVIGISSRRRRDLIRETWMPSGEKLLQLDREKGITLFTGGTTTLATTSSTFKEMGWFDVCADDAVVSLTAGGENLSDTE
ncbi:beta-1,3-galactosyltransferase 7-like protein isoform X2 [Tanacetum coccineum]